MIFEKRGMWKISGYPQKYATREEAEAILAKLTARQSMVEELETQKNEELRILAEKEREERLKKLAEDSTPYEVMIAQNVCLICNLEPCECFTYTEKMEVGL